MVFPNPAFAWVFVLALFGLLAVAAWLDFRTLVLPKWLTLSMLAMGIAANMMRGGCLGGQSREVWILPTGTSSGILDGLLFALAGFGTGFVLFFLMWVVGSCKGGDVKLFAALAAWVGPRLAFLVLIVSVVVVALIVASGMVQTILAGRAGKLLARNKRLLGFGPPLALATIVVVLWSCRLDLHLAPPGLPPNEEVKVH